MKIEIKDLTGIEEGARKFLESIGERRIIALEGAMGAGKTTFTAAVCRVLGMEDEVSSPTFSIVNDYATPDGETHVYHFDFYRIEDPEEALDFGVHDYFDSGSLCIMEWSENIAPLLPEETLCVCITEQPDGSRLLEFNP